ncbi:MAG: DUF5301 domain-containing protein, partial [Oscillospiraceae bacterium]
SLEPSNGMPDSYIYEKGGKYYVERPYSGIWEIGYDTLEEIVEMFTSGAHLSEPLLALPEEYPPSLAAASGDYVDVHGSISNAEAMYSFIKAVSKNEKACIRTTAYTIEGDAIITDFNFDGSGHSVSKDARRDKFGEQTITNYSFSNLVQFTPDTLPAVRCYYVTDLTEITKEDYANGVDGILLASLPME